MDVNYQFRMVRLVLDEVVLFFVRFAIIGKNHHPEGVKTHPLPQKLSELAFTTLKIG